MEQKDIKVSICCITYNQERFIKECLDSLLMQETNFSFEIVIHDDASTDNTSKIIREYEKKYPNIIKPIYELENQYSKNSQKVLEITLNNAIGKYIAFCEGDDYWVDTQKLQKQFDYLEKNPKCTLLSADHQILDKSEIIHRVSVFSEECDVDITTFLKNSTSFQTATLFCRRKDLMPLPSYYYSAHVGDIPIELHLINKGYLHYVPEVVSTYRYQSSGSFSNKNKNDNTLKIINHKKTQEIFEEFNKVTNYKYNAQIKEYLLNSDFKFYLSIDDLKELKKNKYSNLYKKISLKRKIKLHLKNNKTIYNIYKMLKRK